MYMRYVLYFFTLALVFTSGMLVGNFYIPTRNASHAAAVSVPDLDRLNPALDQATLPQAQRNIEALTQALESCPVVVETERERLFNELALFLALQDFELKKATYAAEIAKSVSGAPPTPQFNQAASAYTASKAYAEQLADELFPPAAPAETQASSMTATASSFTAAGELDSGVSSAETQNTVQASSDTAVSQKMQTK